MSFSFIHTADIHLGRPFSDLADLNDKTKVCNQACKLAMEKLINLAISKKVNFVLIAGDSFDSDEHDLSAKLCFIKSLETLANNGILSYVICGNHDPIEMYEKYQSYFRGKYNDLINIVGLTTKSDKYKNCFTFNEEEYNVHALSFETEEMDNPVNYLPKILSDDKKKFNIGLIHCDLDKTESKYSPVTREDLRNLGYDYYALGHIHVPEIKEEKIVYAGTPQARTKKETGSHGCYYVEVKDKSVTNIEFIPTDVVRFENIEIDCSELENKMEIFEEISNKVNNQESDTELTLYEVNLKGVSKAFDDLSKTDNLTKEYLENYSINEKNNVCVFEITNEIKPFINEEELLQDKGVIGIISNTANENTNINLENIYDNISELHENLYKKLNLDTESKELLLKSLTVDKETILENVKNEIKSLCSEIYSGNN